MIHTDSKKKFGTISGVLCVFAEIRRQRNEDFTAE